MKKILTVIVALVASVSAFAQQPVGTLSVAPKAGINLAYMTKAEDASMKLGFIGGVDLTYQMTKKFALSGGLFYSQQGVKNKENGTDIIDGVRVDATYNRKLNNNYFNVPILANYYVAPGLALKAGIQIGALLSAKGKGDVTYNIGGESQTIKEEIDMKDGYNSIDFSIPVGLSYEFSNVIIDARYNFGLTKSIKGVDDMTVDGTKNSVIMLTVGYKINL